MLGKIVFAKLVVKEHSRAGIHAQNAEEPVLQRKEKSLFALQVQIVDV